MKIKTIDLKDKVIRKRYSNELQQFENEFTYPLGEKSFYIRHGYQGNYDYFSFFEQLGDVHYMIVEDDNKIIGAGCAVLRCLNGENVWYLCDFKINKTYRGKHILEKMMLKYFVKCYIKSQKMYFVNMSHKKDNKLIERVKKVFKIFNVNAIDLYFFEWTLNDFYGKGLDFKDYVVLTNKNKKDIVIDDNIFDIYHIVEKGTYIDTSQYQIANIENIKDSDTIMYSSPLNNHVKHLLTFNTTSTIGSFVSHRFNMDNYYSVEI